MKIDDTKGVLKLSELEPIGDMFEFNELVMLRWSESKDLLILETYVTVKIELHSLLEERQEEVFHFIKNAVRPIVEDL